MAGDVGRAVFALGHAVVLRVDVGNGQLHHFKQLAGSRVLLDKNFVGNDLLFVHHEAVVFAIGQLGVELALLAGQRGERHFQPDHIGAGLELGADPVRRPGVIKHRLAGLVAGDGVGNQRRVAALLVRDAVTQLVGGQVVFNHRLAAPAGGAAGQVGLAIAIGIKQLGNFWVGKLADVGDFVLVGGLLVDQVALRGVVRIHAFAHQFAVAAGVLVEVGVHRIPVVGQESSVAIANRQVGGGVLNFFDGFDVVAELLQPRHHQLGLEGFFGNRAF